ncbi:M14 family metallopeptidase [Acidaminobacterium chupaoyuni]
MNPVTSPKEFFGFELGSDYKIARWDKIVEYYKLLDSQSDRISVTEMGPSTEGNPFLKVVITSEDNFKHLEEIRQNNAKIADPRGLSKEEIQKLVENGKAVSVHSMSLHATEIGGTQMAPQLAYDLITGENEEICRIRENVVFVMVPCFNPDGQIMVTDWYNKNLGTEYEGCNYPSLYHKYTGHDNNRDAFAHNIVESQYMGDILFKEWNPQSYFDHHHMGSYGARLFVPPYKNPVRPYTDPLVWNELSLYGANMCYRMEQENLSGISMMSQFPGWGHYGYHWITNSHNIAGMLSESASARLASPLYIHPTQLKGDGDQATPFYGQQVQHTDPWPGGWWHLGDIVKRQYFAAYTVLDTMAKNRKQILFNMTQKALRQTKRGEENPIQAFILPADQYDQGVMRRFIKILLDQGIELHQKQEEFLCGHVVYPKNSYIIPLAQPKMGVVMNLLAQTRYPDNDWTRNKKGEFTAFDTASDTVGEYMGMEIIPANEKIADLGPVVCRVPCPAPAAFPQTRGYVLSAKANDSYHAVNLLLQSGLRVWRINACPYHDFYVEGDAEKLNEIFTKTNAIVRTVDQPYADMTEIRPMKIGVYQRYYTGNADEGWSRLLLDTMEYSYKTLRDKDILSGALEDVDALVLPSDELAMLYGPQYFKNDPQYDNLMLWVGIQPEDKQSALGEEGTKKIAEFVRRGGRLMAFNKACAYAIKACDLRVTNKAAGLPLSQFNTHGSTLKIKVDRQNPLCYGMPENALALHWDGPVFEISERFHAADYVSCADYAQKDVLQSGLLVGEELIAGTPALLSVACGKGDVVLYGFAPQHRCQTHGTFKMVFNALYKNLK